MIKIDFSELNFTYSRSSGPGGQNVNKVNSKVTLHWNPKKLPEEVLARLRQKYPQHILDDGTVQITCQESRSQKMNQEFCIERLNHIVAQAYIRPKVRRATKPTRSSVRKRLESKKKDSEKKQNRRKDY